MAKFDGDEQVFQRGDLVTYCGDWAQQYAHLTAGSLGVITEVAINGRYLVRWITGHPQLGTDGGDAGYCNYTLRPLRRCQNEP